jgi:hypothetical protein
MLHGETTSHKQDEVHNEIKMGFCSPVAHCGRLRGEDPTIQRARRAERDRYKKKPGGR